MWVNVILWSTSFVLMLYSILMLNYRYWFKKLQPIKVDTLHTPQTKFSIIIPARNEENNIGNCLNSIISNNYPNELYEIIVVDDHSEDKTALIVEEFIQQHSNIILIKLATEIEAGKINAYKKKAIEVGINKASGDWIVTTDADCVVKKEWLSLFDNYISKSDHVFIAAPVMFTDDGTILGRFQFIDFMALQTATAASVAVGMHSMCNGANLAYKKSVFIEVEGFKGIDNIASGDDMLLMNKIKKLYPKNIGYLFAKGAIVTTHPMPTWKSFLNQRVRWASKADKYDDKTILPVLVIVYLLNLLIVVLFIIGLIKPFYLIHTAIIIVIKSFFEWNFLNAAAIFFKKINYIEFSLLQALHILYIVSAGWLGKFSTYSWKDRKVN